MVSRFQYLQNLRQQIGVVPYIYGGMSLDGCDCSGSVCLAMELPEKHNAQSLYCLFSSNEVDYKQAAPGCLVFYGGTLSHIFHTMSILGHWNNGTIVLCGAHSGDSTTLTIGDAAKRKAYVGTVWEDYMQNLRIAVCDPFK